MKYTTTTTSTSTPTTTAATTSPTPTPAAPAEEQQVSKSQVVADYGDEKETNSVTTTQSSTMAVVDHTNSSWCHVLGNVCFLGQQAECPHCHESVYKWSGHMKQYMYDINDETSRCQYFHVNCHSERTEVEKKMAAVREEFDFLNTRYTETRKKEKEEARRKRKEEKEAQKKKLAVLKKKTTKLEDQLVVPCTQEEEAGKAREDREKLKEMIVQKANAEKKVHSTFFTDMLRSN